MVLQDTGIPSTSREIYSKDASCGTQTQGFCKDVSVVRLQAMVLCIDLKIQCVLGPSFHVF